MAECDKLLEKYFQLRGPVAEWSSSAYPELKERAIKAQCDLMDEVDRMLPRACWIHMDTLQSVSDVFTLGRGSRMVKMSGGRSGGGWFCGLF